MDLLAEYAYIRLRSEYLMNLRIMCFVRLTNNGKLKTLPLRAFQNVLLK